MLPQKLKLIYSFVVLGAPVSVVKAGSLAPTDGLIGYWSGNGTALDASTNRNDGSFSGTYSSGSPVGGKAFNLATGKVIISHSQAYTFKNYAGWTVGFWFSGNGSTIDANNGLFIGQDNGSGYKPKWFIDYGYTVFGNNNLFNFHVNDFNQERIFVGSDARPPLAGWNQLTVTINNADNGKVSFYLNGQPIGTAPMGNYVLDTTANLVFGQAEGLSFSGLMSNVVMYNRVLDASEVVRLALPAVNSPFSITSQFRDGVGDFVLIWESDIGGYYQVVGAEEVATPMNWKNLGSPVIATGTNSLAKYPAIVPLKVFSVVRP